MENNNSTPKKLSSTTKKIITGSVIGLLSLGFIGSIVGAIFSGGEIMANEQQNLDVGAKGFMRLDKASYKKIYFEGDKFEFNKEESIVKLIAKDPAIENMVNIDNLPAPEWGFIVSKTVDQNGNIIAPKLAVDNSTSNQDSSEEVPEEPILTTTDSQFYENASDITMAKDMGTIFVVSKRYDNIRTPLTYTVYDKINDADYLNNLTIEGEDANVYKNDKLLTSNDFKTKPNGDKPYLTSYGTAIAEEDAAKLSGNACLRNFNKDTMTIDFLIAAKADTTVDLTFNICGRKDNYTFGDYYNLLVNGEANHDFDTANMKADGYFRLVAIPTVKINLKAGINTISLQSGAGHNKFTSACNFDCAKFTCEDKNIALIK